MDRGGSPNEWSPRGPQIPGDSAAHWITAVMARPHDSVIECNGDVTTVAGSSLCAASLR